MPHYKSFLEQALHYFDRPHDRARVEAIPGVKAWRGTVEKTRDDWLETLSPAEADELDGALNTALASGKPVEALTAEDFPLPGLQARLATWRTVLGEGRGFVLLRGFPVERWSTAEAERVFWCFGHHLGIPGAQNGRDELLGHVRNTGAGEADAHVREYQTDWKIGYHCDLADVVGLMCLQPAREGGQSRIVSSVTIFNEILDRRPDLAPLLFQPFNLDRREEGETDMPFIPIQPACHSNGELRTFWHGGYFRSAQRHDSAPRYSEDQEALLDLYDSIANEDGIALDMDLRPGDVQLLSNHCVVHARTAYRDWDEVERRRHLLRLWLTLP